MSFNNGGLNLANSTEGFTPSNCVPLSNAANFWNLCLFFGANILAHAATIHPRTGATKANSFRRMLLMLVAPITAGTVATHAIITFILGIRSGGLKWARFLSAKEGLEEAIPAGAVGIKIPRDLAPVLAGRWKLVGDERYSLMLDHERSHPKNTSKEPHIPTPDAALEFILPPQSKLPGYKDYKFYPTSSFANELIAVVQLIYGVYQLVTQYGPEISVMGLSSPFVWACPYLFMSLVNLVANLLMEGYSHVVILPPQNPEPMEVNATKLSGTSLSLTLKRFTSLSSPAKMLSRTSSTATLSAKRKSGDSEIVCVDDIQLTPVTSTSTSNNASENTVLKEKDIEDGKRETGGFIRQGTCSVGKRWVSNTREWDEQYLVLTTTMARDKKPEKDGLTKKERKRLTRQPNPKLAFITWTCQSSWWGKGQGIRWSSSWSRECNPDPELEQRLERYLETRYPGVKASIHERPLRVYQYSRYVSVFSTLVMMTIVLGVLTHFKFMVAEYCGKFLAWIYGPPMILLVPFLVLQLNKTSAGFYGSVDQWSK